MTLDDCERIFAQIQGASSPSEVCHALGVLFDHYEVINVELNRGFVFWRARFTDERPWATVAQMGYPPAACAKPGRLNDENTPCLYAATREETALQEIEAKEGDLVQLVGFRAKLETPVRIAVIGELLHVQKTGYLRIVGSDPGRSMSRYLNSQGIDRGRRLLYIDAFLSHLLADAEAKNNGYVRSRSIASMIYRNAEIDGIMFPSVRDTLGMNICLQPGPVDSKIHAICCLHVRVTRVRSFGFIEYEVIEEAEQVIADGKFSWVKPLPPPRRRFFNFTKKECETAVLSGGDPSAYMNIMSVHSNER